MAKETQLVATQFLATRFNDRDIQEMSHSARQRDEAYNRILSELNQIKTAAAVQEECHKREMNAVKASVDEAKKKADGVALKAKAIAELQAVKIVDLEAKIEELRKKLTVRLDKRKTNNKRKRPTEPTTTNDAPRKSKFILLSTEQLFFLSADRVSTTARGERDKRFRPLHPGIKEEISGDGIVSFRCTGDGCKRAPSAKASRANSHFKECHVEENMTPCKNVANGCPFRSGDSRDLRRHEEKCNIGQR